ncbi:MAG: hypothetical protein HXN00_00290 [Porphyromonadaceae bacterium]|nr:hypothetical protein [Porphyromonadaceae bacterium]
MNTPPIAPLIIIDKGACHGVDLSGTTAALVNTDDPACGYYLLDGPRLGCCINCDGCLDEITAWRRCVAAPVGELEFMRNVFMGAELSKSQNEAIQRLIARLPKETVNVSNDPLVPNIQVGEVGDDNRVPVTISLVPLSSTYDVP